ncbi:POTRA domain-containing protein, partial [Bradyrhizobium sp. 31Argb]|uniref:POTRA domain-containing protein n=1 Tax=Bradyrhizobium sp. 31Argb TaxID=3141247 RepID=UPI003747EBCC
MQSEIGYKRGGPASARTVLLGLRPIVSVIAGGLCALTWGEAGAAPQRAQQPANASPAPQPANADGATAPAPAGAAAQSAAPAQRFDIDDFAVQGADKLPQIDVEEAIYPFLGPGKSADDVEKARAALEKAYRDKGFQTVSVSVPTQNALRG